MIKFAQAKTKLICLSFFLVLAIATAGCAGDREEYRRQVMMDSSTKSIVVEINAPHPFYEPNAGKAYPISKEHVIGSEIDDALWKKKIGVYTSTGYGFEQGNVSVSWSLFFCVYDADQSVEIIERHLRKFGFYDDAKITVK